MSNVAYFATKLQRGYKKQGGNILAPLQIIYHREAEKKTRRRKAGSPMSPVVSFSFPPSTATLTESPTQHIKVEYKFVYM